MRQSDHPKYPLPDDTTQAACYAGPAGAARIVLQSNGWYGYRGVGWLDGGECLTAKAMAHTLKQMGLGFAGWEPA